MKASCCRSPRFPQIPFMPHARQRAATPKFWLAVILLANFTAGNASDLPTGARALGMGGAYVALANTAEAVFHNPGGLTQLSGAEIAIFYQKPFGLEDVNWGTLAASVPIRDYRASLGLTTLGSGSYSEQALTLAWSHQYRRRLHYGIAVRYKKVKIDGYGASSSVGLELGFLMPLTEKFRWGASAQNVGRTQFGSDEQMPQILRTGLALAATPELLLALEVFKDVRFDEEVRFGVEYRALQQLAARAGVANHPDRFTAGFGLDLKPFVLDYAFFTHNDLGATHQVSLTFRFGSTQRRRGLEAPPQSPIRSGQRPQVQTLQTLPVILHKTPNEELKIPLGIRARTARSSIDFRATGGNLRKAANLQRCRDASPKTFEHPADQVTKSEEGEQ